MTVLTVIGALVLAAMLVREVRRSLTLAGELRRLDALPEHAGTGMLAERALGLVLGPELDVARRTRVPVTYVVFDVRGIGADDAASAVARVRRAHEHAVRLSDTQFLVALWDTADDAAVLAARRFVATVHRAAPGLAVQVALVRHPEEGDSMRDVLRVARANLHDPIQLEAEPPQVVAALRMGRQQPRSAGAQFGAAMRVALPRLALVAAAFTIYWLAGALVASTVLAGPVLVPGLMLLVALAASAADRLLDAPPAWLFALGAVLIGAAWTLGDGFAGSLPRLLGAVAIGVPFARWLSFRFWWAAVVGIAIAVVDIWSVLSASGVTNQLTESGSSIGTSFAVFGPLPGSEKLSIGIPDIAFFAMFVGIAVIWRLPLRRTIVAIFVTLLLGLQIQPIFGGTGIPALPFVVLGFLLAAHERVWIELRLLRQQLAASR